MKEEIIQKGCGKILIPENPEISYKCGDLNKIVNKIVYCDICKTKNEILEIIEEVFDGYADVKHLIKLKEELTSKIKEPDRDDLFRGCFTQDEINEYERQGRRFDELNIKVEE